MLDSEQVDRLLRCIVLGVPKDEVPIKWTEESLEIWDRLTAEVAAIQAQGRQVDLDLD
jgi:hypothetical protein